MRKLALFLLLLCGVLKSQTPIPGTFIPSGTPGTIVMYQYYAAGFPVLGPSNLIDNGTALLYKGNPIGGSFSLTTAGSTGAATYIGGILNIPIYSGGSSGFPIILGSTSIASGSTTTSIAGLTVDGVSPTTFGFLDCSSSCQTQINTKAISTATTTVNSQSCQLSSSCTILLSSAGTISGTTTLTFTCPANNAPAFFNLTLSANVTASSFSGCGTNQPITLRITQAAGNYTLVLPTNLTPQPLIPTVGGQYIQLSAIYDGVNVVANPISTTGPSYSATSAIPGYNPTSGNIFIGFDPSNLNEWVLNTSGTISYTSFPITATANTYLTGFGANGLFTTATAAILGKTLGGTATGVSTGPTTTTNTDVVSYNGTAGQQQDSGIPTTDLARLSLAQTFANTQTFTSSSTRGSMNWGPSTTVPSTTTEGDVWWNSNANTHRPYWWNGTAIASPYITSDELARFVLFPVIGIGAGITNGVYYGPIYQVPVTSLNLTTVKITAVIEGSETCGTTPIVEIRDLSTSPTTAYASSTQLTTLTTGSTAGPYQAAVAVTLTANHYLRASFSAIACTVAPNFYISLSY